MGLFALSPIQIGTHRVETPIILAPMAAVSESPYRIIALELGAGLAPTELVSSKGLEQTSARTEAYLRYDREREPLFCVQVYGGDPTIMARAAVAIANRGAKIIDINMGCPVRKVVKGGAGSALMLDPVRAAAIVVAMRRATGDRIPITAKIRSGWAQKNAPELGQALQAAGAAAISIHARTRTQGYQGRADWDLIRELVDRLSIPVIANGDIFSVEDADRVIEQTGCAGVMIGRAALGNPWIFEQLRAAHRGEAAPARPTGTQRAALVRRHLLENIVHHGDPLRAVRRFRQHLIWYSRGLSESEGFRSEMLALESEERVLELCDRYFEAAVEIDSDEAPIFDERGALG